MDKAQSKAGTDSLGRIIRNARSCVPMFKTLIDDNNTPEYRAQTRAEMLCHLDHVRENLDTLRQIVEDEGVVHVDLDDGTLAMFPTGEEVMNGVSPATISS